MAGIYIHIPFCKSKCSYCNFYSKTNKQAINQFVPSLLTEMEQRKNYLNNATINTIYFGGGTPTLLSAIQYKSIFKKIKELFIVEANAEITIEANPDDLNATFLSELYQLGINRLSIGVQSFNDNDLMGINRRHNAEKALKSITNAQEAGFDNISIDLMYGLPNQTIEGWIKNLQIATQLPIQHLSIYGLSYEIGTPFWNKLQQGKIVSISDEIMNQMYKTAIEECQKNDFFQYEISNFAKKGFHSKHNSAYWNTTPYLGLGPSAHSFNGHSRQWNIASLTQYQDALQNNQPYFEKEILTEKDKMNEFIMLSLRKNEGIDLKQVENLFGLTIKEYIEKSSKKHLKNGYLSFFNHSIALTLEGIFISNQIIADLMLD